eukprot:TRINITY_DN5796_c0_g1_i1.p1 TRINITY_DN5796_c0_g1~~TRINITY_DN5796_c0_g1_i1.p1  ORF type:complete len:111 (+),score=18.56 TRINITY_DN5796_c0_g1_i1:59-391(+)
MLRCVGRPAARVFRQCRPCSSVAKVGTIENEHHITYPTPAVGTPCPVFRSDAEARIAEVPVIMVDGDMAYCDGGGGAMGHPVENIQLNLKRPGNNYCKYCGLRFQSKHAH